MNHKAVLAFCINSDEEAQVDEIIRKNMIPKSHSIKKREYVGIVGVYGPHFREKAGVAANFCELLGKKGINILGISCSISTISCVIDVKEFDKAKDALLEKFQLP
jgi:aspartokinase